MKKIYEREKKNTREEQKSTEEKNIYKMNDAESCAREREEKKPSKRIKMNAMNAKIKLKQKKKKVRVKTLECIYDFSLWSISCFLPFI